MIFSTHPGIQPLSYAQSCTRHNPCYMMAIHLRKGTAFRWHEKRFCGPFQTHSKLSEKIHEKMNRIQILKHGTWTAFFQIGIRSSKHRFGQLLSKFHVSDFQVLKTWRRQRSIFKRPRLAVLVVRIENVCLTLFFMPALMTRPNIAFWLFGSTGQGGI